MQKKLLLFFIFVSFILLSVKNFYTIRVLSALRAYTNAESRYSQRQQNASLYLTMYLQTENPKYVQYFNDAILIPKADNLTRASLLNDSKPEVAIKWFLIGKNDMADMIDMRWLFKTFQSNSFMHDSNITWTDAEPLINKLDSLGQHIFNLQKEGKLTAATKVSYIEEIGVLTVQLSEKEMYFLQGLNKASRDIDAFIQIANILFVLFILILISLFAFRMMNSLSASEKALKVTIIELNDANKELEHFSYIASHDLKEPLRMVTNFLGLLQKRYADQLDEKAQSFINFSIDGARRMKKLIDELLEYSKTSVNKLVYENVDLNEVMKEVKINFQDVFSEPESGLFIQVLPQINANRMQMVQLFQNLTGNAIKYKSAAPPQIRINATSNKTHCIFSVKDNGQGIDKRSFTKIFVIFQRLHTDATHSGSGIGLAICKKIVERHGGKIWLESEPGVGSTFFFSIAKQLPPLTT